MNPHFTICGHIVFRDVDELDSRWLRSGRSAFDGDAQRLKWCRRGESNRRLCSMDSSRCGLPDRLRTTLRGKMRNAVSFQLTADIRCETLDVHTHSGIHVHSKAFLSIPKSIPSHFGPESALVSRNAGWFPHRGDPIEDCRHLENTSKKKILNVSISPPVLRQIGRRRNEPCRRKVLLTRLASRR